MSRNGRANAVESRALRRVTSKSEPASQTRVRDADLSGVTRIRIHFGDFQAPASIIRTKLMLQEFNRRIVINSLKSVEGRHVANLEGFCGTG